MSLRDTPDGCLSYFSFLWKNVSLQKQAKGWSCHWDMFCRICTDGRSRYCKEITVENIRKAEIEATSLQPFKCSVPFRILASLDPFSNHWKQGRIQVSQRTSILLHGLSSCLLLFKDKSIKWISISSLSHPLKTAFWDQKYGWDSVHLSCPSAHVVHISSTEQDRHQPGTPLLGRMSYAKMNPFLAG